MDDGIMISTFEEGLDRFMLDEGEEDFVVFDYVKKRYPDEFPAWKEAGQQSSVFSNGVEFLPQEWRNDMDRWALDEDIRYINEERDCILRFLTRDLNSTLLDEANKFYDADRMDTLSEFVEQIWLGLHQAIEARRDRLVKEIIDVQKFVDQQDFDFCFYTYDLYSYIGRTYSRLSAINLEKLVLDALEDLYRGICQSPQSFVDWLNDRFPETFSYEE